MKSLWMIVLSLLVCFSSLAAAKKPRVASPAGTSTVQTSEPAKISPACFKVQPQLTEALVRFQSDGNGNAAIAAVSKAVARGGRCPSAYLILAGLYEQEEKWRDAQRTLDRYMALPNTPDQTAFAEAEVARMRLLQEAAAKAPAVYARLRFDLTYRLLGSALAAGRIGSIAVLVARAESIDNTGPEAVALAGAGLAQRGLFSAACPYLQRASMRASGPQKESLQQALTTCQDEARYNETLDKATEQVKTNQLSPGAALFYQAWQQHSDRAHDALPAAAVLLRAQELTRAEEVARSVLKTGTAGQRRAANAILARVAQAQARRLAAEAPPQVPAGPALNQDFERLRGELVAALRQSKQEAEEAEAAAEKREERIRELRREIARLLQEAATYDQQAADAEAQRRETEAQMRSSNNTGAIIASGIGAMAAGTGAILLRDQAERARARARQLEQELAELEGGED